MTKEEMVSLCVRKDPEAWTRFVREYESIVRRSVYYKLGRMNHKSLLCEVDDIVQEVFLMLWRGKRLESVRNIESLDGWLAIVSINKTADYAAKRRKERKARSLNEPLRDHGVTIQDLIPSKEKDLVEDLETQESFQRVQKEISNLKERERRILGLSLSGDKHWEIAEIMELPEGTVASVIRRAKEKVRRMCTVS